MTLKLQLLGGQAEEKRYLSAQQQRAGGGLLVHMATGRVTRLPAHPSD